MKKTLIVLLMAVSFYSNAQKDTLNISTYYSNGTDIKALKAFSKQFENRQTFNFVKDYNGNIHKIGDKFKLGMPQKIQGALENTHFLGVYGVDALSTIIPSTDIVTTLRLPGHNWSGAECTIIKIGVRKSLGIAMPFIVLSCLGSEISITSIDYNLLTKELIDPNAPMTSEEAISKLKGLKEKLDLELISKDEYDTQKKELSKFIK
ncbi:MAG: hypothetical protein NTX74_02295 [Flavobacterium sp.]|nr:hypothetical protein [Flavobacterium sp.]